MLKKEDCQVFSSGLRGAEAAFGEEAEGYGIRETVFTFAGHTTARDGKAKVVELSDEELGRGNISMEIVSKMMNRSYYEAEKIRKVLQCIFHVVNRGHQVVVVGTIMADDTVKGGTGWAVELAKLFNRPLSVFDQERNAWFVWRHGAWQEDEPRLEFDTIACSGSRNLSDAGREAIKALFAASFGKA